MRTLPLVLALAGLSITAATPSHASEVVVAYRSSSCGCCKGWLDHLKKAGFTVQDTIVNNLTAIKQRYRVPVALDSCHTATINGYVFEGHVPVSAIEKLLKERPRVAGIAVPGMPLGSPGMESPLKRETYTVFTFTNSGVIKPFQTIKG
ncbi:conserved hypothetical protein (DUF411) [Synechococcus sp. RS9909]|uniref:DUF411 domain-containing protein n=1 Tax=unclassified Synechococcus TaxID=2626047 RepID=UPI001860148B|nr:MULTISPECIES: DUF411 domain-containing protein [unclassified Synechococcus]QNI79282.1 conserved hypothetical protein (DUF411) [Synechococcus sp. RS9909]